MESKKSKQSDVVEEELYTLSPKGRYEAELMKKRDYFAAHALVASLNAACTYHETTEFTDRNLDRLAERAYRMADAMMKERKR